MKGRPRHMGVKYKIIICSSSEGWGDLIDPDIVSFVSPFAVKQCKRFADSFQDTKCQYAPKKRPQKENLQQEKTYYI